LRAAEREDIGAFLTWLNDWDTGRTLGVRAPMSRPMEERWFDRMLEGQGRDGHYFVACLLEDDRAIGSIGLKDLDLVNGSAGLGITVGAAPDRGKGYGTEMLRALLRLCLRAAPTRARVAGALCGQRGRPPRVRARRVRPRGDPSSCRVPRGAVGDVDLMSILAEECAPVTPGSPRECREPAADARLPWRGLGRHPVRAAGLDGVAGIAGVAGPVADGALRTALAAVGLAAMAAGGLLALRGVIDLRESLTALPHPRDGATLVEHGVYRLVRHPIYGGIIIGSLGFRAPHRVSGRDRGGVRPARLLPAQVRRRGGLARRAIPGLRRVPLAHSPDACRLIATRLRA